ncbi:MAG TPA: glycoside hydrolase family 15 protein [Bacteroidales bacterium]|nr:glycoside hydrolase family 15 protein [Bacteroidales bacterium]
MSYQPIENYGIIGDLNTVALVGMNGSIDFMCFPDFDSPSVFASLLDEKKGGYYLISPVNSDIKCKQLYIPDTNVLLTRFLSVEGVGEITDFMPVKNKSGANMLIRSVRNVRGSFSYRMNCCPRFNYARSGHSAELKANDKEIIFSSHGDDGITLRLKSNIELLVKDGDGVAEFRLDAGQSADFVLELIHSDTSQIGNLQTFVSAEMYETMNFWKNWISLSRYNGRWEEIINRSALVLKLMTSKKYGSLIASPTFSLPEFVGGDRNWDYRYTWIRDASFTIYTMINLGYIKEAGAFMKWVEKECSDIGNAGYLGLMRTINGNNTPNETILTGLEGYKKSSPVRIGNNAKDQVQLDIYGELMDSVYLYNKYGEPVSYGFWKDLATQIDWLCDNWMREDEGIWEVRGGKRQFLYSRLMCWVAFDRVIRLANMRSFPVPSRWIRERDTIFGNIFEKFWNKKLNAFVQYEGADTIDASVLLMPLMRFISSTDPMWLSTLREVEKELVSDSLVFRYRHTEAAPDGLKSGEGTFSMCTFWYIECLSRSGQLQKARLYFEKMLGYANHLGLYAEQLGFQGEHLGNFPQAFTHLGLVSAAINLNSRLNDERNKNFYDGENQ